MIVLGIETATLQGSVALMGEAGLLSEYFLNVEATHSERLLTTIDRILTDARLSFTDVGGLAVSIGPGSFTGLRIGLATAKGLALTREIPLVGVPTLEAMAASLPFCRYPICPVLDARKGEVYAALFDGRGESLLQVREDAALSPEALVEWVTEPTVFLGDGVERYGEFLAQRLGGKLLAAPASRRHGSAAVVAERGRARLLRGEADDLVSLVPRYIRPSEAELQRARREAEKR